MMADLVHGAEAERFGGWDWAEPLHGEHFHRCTFCGSIDPKDLAREPTWEAEWADRKYGWPHKFYADIVNRDPERLYVVGSSTHPLKSDDPGRGGWRNVEDLTGDEAAALDREYPPGDKYRPTGAVLIGTRPKHFAKFYTVHLADPQIPAEVKEAIEQRSGLHFDFADGRVAWSRAAV
jgi:translation initiation factor 2 beta subunit (eIF-2beta)/eIF-5